MAPVDTTASSTSPALSCITRVSESHRTSVFLLGISGPASAGKTTLSHLLSAVFSPNVKQILHGDDFCKDLKTIPVRNGYIDADGPDGVDFVDMAETLDYIKANEGKIPGKHKSWQYDVYPDQEARALRTVPEHTLERLTGEVSAQLGGARFSIIILEGFLLYSIPEVCNRLDGKLFLRLDHKEAKHRRMTRPLYGAEAKEGEFWKTEGYLEEMVWKNYVEQHADLFEDGNVEGRADRVVCSGRGIFVQEATNVEVEKTLCWAVDSLISFLRTYDPRLKRD